jgi:hypothetical protein
LLEDAVEGRDATGPAFTGKAVRVGRDAAGLPPLPASPTVIET